MAKYRKKTLTDAIEWTGDNWDEVLRWAKELGADTSHMGWCRSTITIRTLEGDMEAQPHDRIMCGAAKELYPCKPEIFEATYELAD